MVTGYKKKPQFIVIFSFFYLLYPIINLVAFLTIQPPGVALSTLHDFILEKPTYMLVNILLWLTTFPLSYGLFRVRKWAWFYFVVHASMVIFMSIFSVVAESTDVQPRLNLVFLLNLLLLVPMAFFIKKEIRTPYLNPQVKWWEQAARVRHTLNIVYQNEEYETFDISQSGVFILDKEGKINAYPEDILPVSIILDNNIIKCYSEVVWVNRQASGNLPQGIGIKFLNLKKEEILQIKLFMKVILEEGKTVSRKKTVI